MAKESTLNNADVALVARSIQTAVDKYKLHPVSESAEKSIENGDTKIKVENVKNVKVKANTEIKIVSDVKKDEKKEETKEQVKQPDNDNVVVNEGEKVRGFAKRLNLRFHDIVACSILRQYNIMRLLSVQYSL